MIEADENSALVRAISSVQSGQLQDALRAFEEAIEAHPQSPKINLEFGNFIYQLGQTDQALQRYRRAVELDPGMSQAVTNMAAILFSQERWDEAIAAFESLLALNPNDAVALNNIGNVHFERGDFSDALTSYQAANKIDPGWWEPLHNLATTWAKAGDMDAAILFHSQALEAAPLEASAVISACDCFLDQGLSEEAEKAITTYRASAPELLETELIHGRVLVMQERFDEAIAHYKGLESVLPRSMGVQSDLAAALSQAGYTEAAIEKLEKIIEAERPSALNLTNLAKACLKGDKFADAIRYFTEVLQTWPETPEIARHLAIACRGDGQVEEAVNWYIIALRQQEGNSVAYVGLSSSLAALHRSEEALEAARKAVSLDPDNPAAFFAEAVASQQLDDNEGVAKACLKALSLDSEYSLCRALYAHVLLQLKKFHEATEQIELALRSDPDNTKVLQMAIDLFRASHQPMKALAVAVRLMKLDPDSIYVLAMIVDTVLTACAWQMLDSFLGTLIAAIDKRISNGEPVGICVNNLHALPVSYKTMVEAGRNASEHILSTVAADQPEEAFDVSRDGYTGKRIRIGYLLPYVRFHSMPLVIKDIVERHDREKFEVFGYSYSTVPKTAFAAGFSNAFDHFHASSQRSVLAQAIHDDGIELLIDCSGHTEATCLDVAALRPAPVNIHFLGYSVSMGASFMDYFITDRISVPDHQKDMGPEKIIYMPDSFMPTMRPVIEPVVPSRTEEGLPEDGIVFCNFNQPFKMEPEIFGCWMKILKAVPGSVLWLGTWNDDARENLRLAARQLDVDPDRIVTGTIVKHAVHLARLALADLALDTHQHGGGITTVDCLWAGLPVLSARGDTPGAMLGETLLRAHGLPELVAGSLDEYCDLAIDLARDPERLAEFRERCLANKDTAPLFDVDKYLNNLEAGLIEASEAFRRGDKPEHIRQGQLQQVD